MNRVPVAPGQELMLTKGRSTVCRIGVIETAAFASGGRMRGLRSATVPPPHDEPIVCREVPRSRLAIYRRR